MKKLKNNRGETLIEALVAILIFAISSVVLYTLITTATDLNAQAKQTDARNQSQLVAAEKREGTGKSATVTIALSSGDEVDSVDVSVYGDTEGLYAYYADEEG